MDKIQDTTHNDLQEVALTGTLKAGEKVLADLRKRKLIIQKYRVYWVQFCNILSVIFRKGQWFTIHKGPQFSTSTARPETDLTADMLVSLVVANPLF